MKPLFSRSGREALGEFLARYPDPLILLDFDGTLAPITRLPSRARMAPTTRTVLRKLCARYDVGIISGRSIEDLRPKIPKEIQLLVGNHGLEVTGLRGVDHTKRRAWEARARKLSRIWKASLLEHLHTLPRGVWIEDKDFSLTLHFRDTSLDEWEVKESLKHWRKGLPDTASPGFVAGKRVMNIVLKNAPDKGTTALECLKALERRAFIFVGDDVTDEAVFKLKRRNLLGLRVGKNEDSQAHFYLRGIPETEKLLQHLVEVSSQHVSTQKRR